MKDMLNKKEYVMYDSYLNANEKVFFERLCNASCKDKTLVINILRDCLEQKKK